MAARLGIELPISIDQRIAGAEKVGEHKTSMLQDLEAGRPLELEPWWARWSNSANGWALRCRTRARCMLARSCWRAASRVEGRRAGRGCEKSLGAAERGALVAMIMIANLQYAWTLFVNPIQASTGWKLSDIQWGFTLFILCQTWVMPLEGWLIDRLGAAHLHHDRRRSCAASAGRRWATPAR